MSTDKEVVTYDGIEFTRAELVDLAASQRHSGAVRGRWYWLWDQVQSGAVDTWPPDKRIMFGLTGPRLVRLRFAAPEADLGDSGAPGWFRTDGVPPAPGWEKGDG